MPEQDHYAGVKRVAVVALITNQTRRRFMTVFEHQENAPGPLTFVAVDLSTNGAIRLSVTCNAGLRYRFEASTNLVNWSWLGVRTNLTGTVEFLDTKGTNFVRRFYRVLAP